MIGTGHCVPRRFSRTPPGRPAGRLTYPLTALFIRAAEVDFSPRADELKMTHSGPRRPQIVSTAGLLGIDGGAAASVSAGAHFRFSPSAPHSLLKSANFIAKLWL